MKSYEFSRYYHPKMGKFVYKHKGTGVIVDNIFKPMKAAASAVFKKFAKPVAKKALEAGISHAGEKLGKKAAEKSGDIIAKRLAKMTISPRPGVSFSTDVPGYEKLPYSPSKHEEDSDAMLNRLISGSGLKKKKRKNK